MAFKLGSSRGPILNKGQVNSKLSFKQEDSSIPGTPVLRKDLGKGILGEANNDGTIYVDKDIPSGSAKEKEVIKHEIVHQEDMKKGDLGYTDNDVTWKGKKYARKDGKIQYKGKWMEEGDHSLPWEKKAHNA